MKKFDALIIGSGQGGTPLAKKLAEAGLKTAIIEKKQVGGTCVNDGCTPTKAMIACAKMAYLCAQSREWGIDVPNYTVDFKKIISRKNEIVHSFRSSNEKGLQETEGLTLFRGAAAFIDHKTLQINGEGKKDTITAEKIFINTGLKSRIPNVEGLEKIPYYTSSTLLDAKELPSELIILGGSYIGLEFGQMFSRFGSKVTIIEKGPQLLSREDEDIANAIKEILEEEGIDVYTHASVEKITQDKQLDMTLTIDKEERKLTGSHLLVATGRIPQTKTLALEKTGVATDANGYIKVNNHLETNVSGIFALGDTKGGPAFTHVSYNDYIILSQNLLEGASLSIADRQVPYCLFTDPQLGRIGMSEKEALEKGYDIETACLPMSHTSRGIETGHTKGLMKAVVDHNSGTILGVAVLGEEGGEVMSVLQMAMKAGFTAQQLKSQIFAHPLYTESLNNLFMSLGK